MSELLTTDHARKLGKLGHYADRPLQRFLQMDGFVGCHPDDYVMGGDDDGDCVMFCITEELMGSPGERLPIRVLIHEDARPEDVRRLVVKLTESLDAAFRFLREPADLPF